MRVVIFWSMYHPSRGLEKKKSLYTTDDKSNVYSYESHYVISFKYQLIIN